MAVPTQPDMFEFLMLGIIFDGLLTIINLAVLAISVKLYSEFYKVKKLTEGR